MRAGRTTTSLIKDHVPLILILDIQMAEIYQMISYHIKQFTWTSPPLILGKLGIKQHRLI